MSTEIEQIKLSYESLNMTPEEIAEDRSLEVEAVKATLMSCSTKYRSDCTGEPEEKDDLNFSREQLRRVNERIFNIAVGSDNEAIALKAAMYVRDDKKGRRDVVKALSGVTFNVLQFNEQLKNASKVVEAALGIQEKTTDI